MKTYTMAFGLFRFKNTLFNKTNVAIYRLKINSSCISCSGDYFPLPCYAVLRTSSTAIPQQITNEKHHQHSCSTLEAVMTRAPTLGRKNHKNDAFAVCVNLSEILHQDPLAILLNSGLLANNVKCNSSTKVHHKEESKYNQKTAADLRTSSCASLPYSLHSYNFQCLENTFIMSQNPEYPHILQQGNLTTQWNKSYKEISIICSADSGMKLAGSSLPSPNSRDDCIPNKNDAGTNPLGLPTPDKLKHVHDVLVSSLKKFFAQTPNYTIFDKDVIFENRFRGTVTKGLFLYVTQMYILNTIGHMKHAYVHMDIIKTTIHPEDGTVKVRWRIKGIKSRQAFIGFWKARKWSISDVKQDDMFNWYDGFSTFHVNSEGLIYRHVADNMMPDEEKLSSRPGTIAKLAVAIGLWPRPVAGHSSVIQEMPSLF